MNRKWTIWIAILAGMIGILLIIDAGAKNAAASTTAQDSLTFDVSKPVVPKLSPAVRDLQPAGDLKLLDREINALQWLGETGQESNNLTLNALTPQGLNPLGTTPPVLVDFEGLGTDGFAPPDTVGDVGPNHYIQMVNVSFQIWDKGDPDNGIPPSIVQPDTAFNQLFAGFGGPCQNSNDGDPIVMYDDMADRWFLSQFAVSSTPQYQCIAISTTPDPTGTYYLYAFPMPDFPDYPKFGVWPDAYYMTTNTGFPNQYYAHAFDRANMLAGNPATRQSFGGLPNLMLPADVDGFTPPPAGEPGIFYTFFHPSATGHPPGPERLAFYEFDVDWLNPNNSTYTLVAELPIAPFNYTVCGFFAGGCIPQPGTSQLLDDIAWWPMHRLQYRNFGSYAAMVGNFSVDPDGSDRAAIRWFEVRKTGSSYSLYQEGTYAPDTDSRWMGSIAMDVSGNIALGYSVSSSTTKPAIRYATRETGDPLGTLNAEQSIIEGGGVQTGIYRWGDYSALSVDPVDGCTFWYTTEYHDVNDSGFNWNTRIGVFRIPSCGRSSGKLTGQVTDSGNNAGIGSAQIAATLSLTQTFITFADPNGFYTATLPAGTYTVTASAFSYLPGTITGVTVISGGVTTQNFALDPAPTYVVDGYVTDSTTGWPLYAEINITGYSGNPVWTNPATGYYSVTLPADVYNFTVDAWVDGYLAAVANVSVSGDTQQDFALDANLAACTAPGYSFDGPLVETFESGGLPSGWTVIDNAGTGGVWAFDDPGGRGNLTGGSGGFAIVDSDFYGTGNSQDTELHSPVIDLTGVTTVTLEFDYDLNVYSSGNFEIAEVDVSPDGGGSWTNVWRMDQNDGDSNGHVTLDISAIAANQSDVVVRFHYYDATWEWWWQVDNVGINTTFTCSPPTGGLVVGNVYDENTGAALSGATISNEDGYTALALDTPDDPAVDDGFYTLYALADSKVFTATYTAQYGADVQSVVIIAGDTTGQDFYIPAGALSASPAALDVSLFPGETTTLTLDLDNLGSVTTVFTITEQPDVPWLTESPITGTLPGMNTTTITVTFWATSGIIANTGTYTASLVIQNDTPYGDLTVPVTMTVTVTSPLYLPIMINE